MSAIPVFNILPAQKIPMYAYKDESGDYHLKPQFRQVFGTNIIWLNQEMIKFWGCKAKFQIFKGGSASGKSHFVARRLLFKVLQEKYCRVLYLRKHFSDIRKSCYQLFKDLIAFYRLGSFFTCRDSDYEIICSNGNKLVPAGLDDVEKLKSIEGISDVWFEEVITKDERITAEEFRTVVQRVRTDKARHTFYLTFNPIDKDNFVYDMFVENPIYDEYDWEKDNRNAFVLHTSNYQHNFFVDEDYKESLELLKRSNFNEWLIYACGEWGNPKTGMEFITNFSKATHVKKVPYNPNFATYLAFDANVNPYITCTVSQFKILNGQRYLSIIDEVCLKQPKNEFIYIIEELKNRGYLRKGNVVYFMTDISMKNRIPGFGDRKDVISYQVIKQLLRPYTIAGVSDLAKITKKNPAKLLARSALISILGNRLPNSFKNSNIVFEIDENCKNTIKDFDELQLGGDGFDPKRTTENGVTFEKMGHCFSTVVYIAAYHFKEYFKKSKYKML